MPAMRWLFKSGSDERGVIRATARPQRSEDGRAREARLDLYQGHLTNEAQEMGASVKFSPDKEKPRPLERFEACETASQD